MNESLSALLDGECSPSELERLLSDLERDPALRAEFSRLCLARELRHGTRVRSAQPDFPSRVMAALDRETAEPAVVIPIGNRVRRLPWRAAASLAAAAAVGAVAVMAIRPAGPVLAASPAVALSQPAVTPAEAEGELVETRYAELDDENARQLRNYLMTYQSRGQGVGATLGYARYAAYTDERPAQKAGDPKR
jgi:negative regulator of sigma E activity